MDREYPSAPAAQSAGSRLASSRQVRQEITRLLSEGQPIEQKLAQAVDKALVAIDDKGNEDHGIRLKAVDIAAKVIGAYDPDPNDRTPTQHLHLHLDKGLSRFVVLHGRYPTGAERQALGLPEADGLVSRETIGPNPSVSSTLAESAPSVPPPRPKPRPKQAPINKVGPASRAKVAKSK